MTSALHLLQVKVITSAVRTDHEAILATPGEEIQDRTKTSSTRTFRRRSSGQHAELLYHLRNFSSEQYEVTEPDVAWSEFYATIIEWMDTFYPLRTITITSRDPACITPELKFLLRWRNWLMRQQKTDQAAALTLKIGREITRFNSRELRKLDASGTKNLWAAVNKLTGERGEKRDEPNISAEDLNTHFAQTSTDPLYQQPSLKTTARPNQPIFSEQQIFGILDHLRPTAEGLDLVPAWFPRTLAPVCSAWLARLFNISLCCS